MRLGTALIVLLLVMALTAAAQGSWSCGGGVFPAAPSLGQPPVVKVIDAAGWTAPACTGWKAAQSGVVVLTSGRFQSRGGLDELRKRIGEISRLAGIVYWSTTDERWEPLILSAHALTGPDGKERGDFSVKDIAQGHTLYFEQEDNRLAKAQYRLEVRKASEGELVCSIENTNAIKVLGVPLAQAGEIQTVYVVESESRDVWRFGSIGRLSERVGMLVGRRQASLINRAVALYRYVAGMPGNLEPPAAR
jgi:hypothetical protein